MKIKIQIQANKVPIFYRNRFLAMIKQAVSISNDSFARSFFKDDTPKPFTFSVSFGRQKNKQEWITLAKTVKLNETVFYPENSRIDIYLSSTNAEFLLYLVDGLKKMRYFDFSHGESFQVNDESLIYKILDVKPVEQKPIKRNEVVMNAFSPMFFEDENKKPILFNNDKFNDNLNTNVNRIFKLLGHELKDKLIFEAIDMRKQVVKHTFSDLLKSSIPFFLYSSNEGLFKLKGDMMDLDIIRNIGLGNKTSQGFGMVDLI